MSSPEFRVTAKITVNETNINWKGCRNTAKGRITLLDAEDKEIQSFPFEVDLNDPAAFAQFANLISQEQLVKTLADTVQNEVIEDPDDAAMDILDKIRLKGKQTKKSLNDPFRGY